MIYNHRILTGMLQVQDLSVAVDQKQVLNNISFEINQGSLVCLVGPNGAGKSTLLRVISGLETAIENGSIIFNTHDVTQLSISDRFHKGIMITYQSPVPMEGVTVIQLCKAILPNLPTAELVQKISSLAARLGLPDDLYKRTVHHDLSGGQKKLLELLQVMLIQPKLLLCDEIDSGLDITKQAVVSEVLDELRNQGVTILCVTHSLSLAKQLKPDKVVILQQGQIVKSGNAALIKTIQEYGFSAIN